MTDLWKRFCLNQFHDILPGCAITEVFDDALEEYLKIDKLLDKLISSALSQFRSDQGVQPNTIMKYHPFEGWCRPNFNQITAHKAATKQYVKPFQQGDLIGVENKLVRIEIGQDANIKRITHAKFGDLIAHGKVANVFKAYVDRPLMWDAWDIDPFYQEQSETLNYHKLNSNVTVKPCADGVLIEIDWKNSSIKQKIQLPVEQDTIHFKTKVDWHQKNMLLKVEFPVAINSDFAKYHIPFGSIERTTKRDDKIGRAQYEVSAHFWAAICDKKRGFALINDCKYGYSIDQTGYGNKLTLSLIKSAIYPDPQADQGRHEFEYAIVSFERQNQRKIWESAYALNRSSDFQGDFPEDVLPISGFKNLILEGIFWSEQKFGLVARFFEPFGNAGSIALKVADKIPYIIKSDIMERSEIRLVPVKDVISFDVRAFEAITLIIPKPHFV